MTERPTTRAAALQEQVLLYAGYEMDEREAEDILRTIDAVPVQAETMPAFHVPASVREAVEETTAIAALCSYYADDLPGAPTEASDWLPGTVESMRSAIAAADHARTTTEFYLAPDGYGDLTIWHWDGRILMPYLRQPHVRTQGRPDLAVGETRDAVAERLWALLTAAIPQAPLCTTCGEASLGSDRPDRCTDHAEQEGL
jgi:hypothetical protein